MATKQLTDGPLASYTMRDHIGEHNVTVERASRFANRYVAELYRETGDTLVREVFRYIHGHRDRVPVDVWHGFCQMARGDVSLVCVESRGSIETVTVCRDTQDGLKPEHQSAIQTAHEVWVIGGGEASRVFRDELD